MSVWGIPRNYFEAGYNWKHAVINDELYLYFPQIHIRTHMVVAMTMAVLVIAIIIQCTFMFIC